MKLVPVALLSLIFMNLAVAGPEVIIPSKAIDHLFYLYKNYTIDGEDVKVQGQSFKRVGVNKLEHDETGHSATVPLKSFIFYRYLGASVFKVQTGGGNGAGTASLIGKNLILTNQHVLSTDNTKKECGKFEVYLDEEQKVVSTCKKVLYCDTQDFCVAEMNQINGKDLSDIVRPLTMKTTGEKKSKKLIIVGNAYNMGLQGSSGKDYKYITDDTLIHHTPTLSGSSGSPIFNEQGEMIGLNYANNSQKGYVDENADNLAVPADYIIKQLKKNLTAELFNTIKLDKPLEEKIISSYEEQFRIMSNVTERIKISDSLIIKSIESGSTADIKKEISSQSKAIKKELTQFSARELDLSSDHPILSEIGEINSYLGDFQLQYDARKTCFAKKDLTRECQVEYFLEDLVEFKLFASFNSQQRANMVQKRLNLPETSASDIIAMVKNKRELLIHIFKQCLNLTKKFTLSEETVFFGDYSSVYYGNKACQDTMISEIRNSGIHWTDPVGGDSDLSFIIASNTFISELENSFEKDVARKWKFGLLGGSGKKTEKVAENKKNLQLWLGLIGEDDKLDEWYEIISKKLKKALF